MYTHVRTTAERRRMSPNAFRCTTVVVVVVAISECVQLYFHSIGSYSDRGCLSPDENNSRANIIGKRSLKTFCRRQTYAIRRISFSTIRIFYLLLLFSLRVSPATQFDSYFIYQFPNFHPIDFAEREICCAIRTNEKLVFTLCTRHGCRRPIVCSVRLRFAFYRSIAVLIFSFERVRKRSECRPLPVISFLSRA